MVRSSFFIIAPVRGFVLSVHAALGDRGTLAQQDRSSRNQDGAADVQDGGAHAAGGVGPKGFPFGEAVCEADWP